MQFHTPDMSCSGCAQAIARAIAEVDPAARVRAEVASGRIEVGSDHAPAVIAAAIQGAGFRLSPAA